MINLYTILQKIKRGTLNYFSAYCRLDKIFVKWEVFVMFGNNNSCLCLVLIVLIFCGCGCCGDRDENGVGGVFENKALLALLIGAILGCILCEDEDEDEEGVLGESEEGCPNPNPGRGETLI